ncbi:hypothetical protein FQR65_LT15390 [Abscondita terminalis]|nr:hypothetical protein FQR65_LT15390 [Abscondita terminalis]
MLPDVPAKIPRLKKNAVPSLNLPKKSIETMKPTSRRRNFNKENQDQISIDLCNKNVTANNIPTPQCRIIDNLHENEKLAISSMLDLVNDLMLCPVTPMHVVLVKNMRKHLGKAYPEEFRRLLHEQMDRCFQYHEEQNNQPPAANDCPTQSPESPPPYDEDYWNNRSYWDPSVTSTPVVPEEEYWSDSQVGTYIHNPGLKIILSKTAKKNLSLYTKFNL